MFKVIINLSVLLLLSLPIVEQDHADSNIMDKSIKIEYYGQAAFGITTSNGTKIIIDPANFKGYKMPTGVTADIVTVSHEHIDHNAINTVSGSPIIFHGTDEKCRTINPLDTTINDVRLYSVPSFHDPGHHGVNAIFVFAFDGIRLVHMGEQNII